MSTNEMQKVTFRLPDQANTVDTAFTAEELEEDREGLSFNLTRVKIPAGGQLSFELPGDSRDEPDIQRTLQGVIVYKHSMNTCWSEDDDDKVPLCTALEGQLGAGNPGGACLTCDFNKFGTAIKGKGKRCKNMRVLYLLRDGECMPLQINLPPTSLKSFGDFYTQNFTMRKRGLCGSVVEIGLTRKEADGTPYSVATFKVLGDLEGEDLAAAKAYSAAFREQLKGYLARQSDEAALAMAAADAYIDYGESRFNAGAGAVVAAGREELP